MYSSISFSSRTVGFILRGKLNLEAIENLHSEILTKMKDYRSINLYLEDLYIEQFTLPAILEQIKFKTANAGNISKVAIVTDRKWIHLCGAIENTFLSTTIKVFDTEDRLEGLKWIQIDEI